MTQKLNDKHSSGRRKQDISDYEVDLVHTECIQMQ